MSVLHEYSGYPLAHHCHCEEHSDEAISVKQCAQGLTEIASSLRSSQ
jgi:hypothetical protein